MLETNHKIATSKQLSFSILSLISTHITSLMLILLILTKKALFLKWFLMSFFVNYGILRYQTRKFYDQRIYTLWKAWQSLRQNYTSLTEEELIWLRVLMTRLPQDVTDIYLPLAHLIQIYKRSKEDLSLLKGIFLQRESKISLYYRNFR